MHAIRRISAVMMAIGLAGLVFSLTALLRDRWGSELYLIAGATLLALGAILYWIAARRERSGAANSAKDRQSDDRKGHDDTGTS
jgi:hypothetical protein